MTSRSQPLSESQRLLNRLAELRDAFIKVAGEDNQIDRAEFQGSLGLKDAYLSERLFSLFDGDRSGEISFTEFKALMGKSPDLLEAMTVSSVSWLTPHEPEPETLSPQEKKRQERERFKHYL
ncbi:MAG: hypothetical protein SVX43_16490, partial [Cyanobacteriota bacterium]|nr:hypothetical protein [Cyanobacteriota bacterium]